MKKYDPILLLLMGVLLAFPLAMPSSFNINEEVSEFFITFPKTVQGWTGEDVPVEEKVYEILETRNVLSRDYKRSEDEVVNLLLVESKKDRRVAHPPEVCYIGSNYEITQEDSGTLEGNADIAVKEFVATSERNSKDKQFVQYLYKVGDKYTTSYYAQQLQFAMDRITKKETAVLLIRVAGRDEAAVQTFLKDVLTVIK